MTTADKTPVIDADAHVVESAHTWDYMDSSEKQYRPDSPGNPRRVRSETAILGHRRKGPRDSAFPLFQPKSWKNDPNRLVASSPTAQESRELGNVDLRLEHMDETGVDVQVLHNTMFIESATDRAAVEVALCKSWNRWLADIWRQGKGRLRWSCMAPTLSIPDALDQIRYAKENGACAVLMRPVEGNRLLVDPYFYPIYDEASRLDMAIAIHIANGNAWLCDLYRHPVGVASTLHRFRVPTVAAFNDIVLSEIPQALSQAALGLHRSQRAVAALGDTRSQEAL